MTDFVATAPVVPLISGAAAAAAVVVLSSGFVPSAVSGARLRLSVLGLFPTAANTTAFGLTLFTGLPVLGRRKRRSRVRRTNVVVTVRVRRGRRRRQIPRGRQTLGGQQPFHPLGRYLLGQHLRVRGQLAQRRVRFHLNFARQPVLVERQVQSALVIGVLGRRVRVVMVLLDHLVEHALLLEVLLQHKHTLKRKTTVCNERTGHSGILTGL